MVEGSRGRGIQSLSECGVEFCLPSLFYFVTFYFGNVLVLINEVTLPRALLLLGWLTVCGQINNLSV